MTTGKSRPIAPADSPAPATQKVRRRKGVASTSSGRLSPISPGAGVAKWLQRSRTVNQQAANAGEVDLDRLRFRRSHL